jgi:hypothetical protein
VKPLGEDEIDEMFQLAERDDLGPADLERIMELRERAVAALRALGVSADGVPLDNDD